MNQKSPHILNTSSNLLGLCFIVLTSIKVLNISKATVIDEITGLTTIAFATSCIFSFLSIRTTDERLGKKFETIADAFFLAGLLILFVIVLFITLNVLR